MTVDPAKVVKTILHQVHLLDNHKVHHISLDDKLD